MHVLTQGSSRYDVGFDPIFWLHHANVDRLLQLWSSRHPDVWVSEGHADKDGTIDIPPYAVVDKNTGSLLVSSTFSLSYFESF